MTQAIPNTRQVAREGQRLLESLQDQFAEEDYDPGKLFYLGRVGCRTAYTFKGRR